MAPGMPLKKANPSIPCLAIWVANRMSGIAVPDRDGKIIIDGHIAEVLTGEANDHPFDATIAHEHVRAKPDHRDGNVMRQMPKEEGQIRFVLGIEEKLGRSPHAKPCVGRNFKIALKTAAHLTGPVTQLRQKIIKCHIIHLPVP